MHLSASGAATSNYWQRVPAYGDRASWACVGLACHQLLPPFLPRGISTRIVSRASLLLVDKTVTVFFRLTEGGERRNLSSAQCYLYTCTVAGLWWIAPLPVHRRPSVKLLMVVRSSVGSKTTAT